MRMSASISRETHATARRAGFVWAAAAALGLLSVYVLVLGLANSLQHVVDEFLRLWPWMSALTVGFATQVGLFGYARAAMRGGRAAGSGAVAATGGTSTLSMVACCAHHLTDVLPLMGLAGAAFFLAAYQQLFLLLGVLSNLVGLVYVMGVIRRHRLYPPPPSLLSLGVRWPVDRALPYVLAGSVLVFAVATVLAVV